MTPVQGGGKVDQAATNGLAGVSNSLAYRVHEIEKHFHSPGYWWGALAGPDETNAIEENVTRPFDSPYGEFFADVSRVHQEHVHPQFISSHYSPCLCR